MSSGPRRSSISLSVSDMLTSDAPPDRYGEQHEAVGHAGPSRGRDPHTTSAPAQHGRGGHYHPPGKMPSPDGLPPPMLILPHPRHSRPPYPPYYDDHRGPPTRQRSDPMPGPYQDRERLRGGYYDPRYEPYPRRSDHHRPPYPADDSYAPPQAPVHAPHGSRHTHHVLGPVEMRPLTPPGYGPSGSAGPGPNYAVSPPSLRPSRIDSRDGPPPPPSRTPPLPVQPHRFFTPLPPSRDTGRWPPEVADAYRRGYDDALIDVSEGSVTLDNAVYRRVPLYRPDNRERPGEHFKTRDDDRMRFGDRPAPDYGDRGGGPAMVGPPLGPPNHMQPQRPPSGPQRYNDFYSPAPQAQQLPPYYTPSPPHPGRALMYPPIKHEHATSPPSHGLPLLGRPPSGTGVPAALQPIMRHRQMISCHPCRSRKVKCSGGKPCDACIKIKRTSECEYEKTVRRRGKGRKRSDKSQDGRSSDSGNDNDEPSGPTTTQGSDQQRSERSGHGFSDTQGGESGSDARVHREDGAIMIDSPPQPPSDGKKRRESNGKPESPSTSNRRTRDSELGSFGTSRNRRESGPDEEERRKRARGERRESREAAREGSSSAIQPKRDRVERLDHEHDHRQRNRDRDHRDRERVRDGHRYEPAPEEP